MLNPIETAQFNLSKDICKAEIVCSKVEVIRVSDVKEFIRLLKEEFHKCWNPNFEDSILNPLTAHDEMCHGDLPRLNLKANCSCREIIDNFIDKLAGEKLKKAVQIANG